MPASRTLSAGCPNYLESWIFRRRWLRQLKASARAQSGAIPVAREEITAPETEASAALQTPTPREAARLLADMAVCFQTELERACSESSNLHRRRLTGLTADFQIALESARIALGTYADGEDIAPELRESAARIAILLDDLQTNIPVWHLARGLQLFAGDCQRLARSTAIPSN